MCIYFGEKRKVSNCSTSDQYLGSMSDQYLGLEIISISFGRLLFFSLIKTGLKLISNDCTKNTRMK